METTLIRGFVLFLALTGFGASNVSSRTTTVKVHANGATPMPMCTPNSACGKAGGGID